MTDATFETRLGLLFDRYADGGVRPIDDRAIAQGLLRGPQGRLARWTAALTPPYPRLATSLVLALLALLILAAALWIGSRQAPVPPGRLAIVSGGDITVTMADGTRPRPVVEDPGVAFDDVIWLDDGSRIAVRGANLTTVVDLRTGDRRRVDAPQVEANVWRPGAHEVALVGTGADGRAAPIELLDIDSGARRAIALDIVGQPIRWSSDGTKLLVADGDQLVVVDVQTGRRSPLPALGGAAEELHDPAVALDGTLAGEGFTGGVTDIVTKTGTPNERRVLVAAADGSAWRPVTDVLLEDPSVSDGPWAGLTPAISPDGLWIAYRANGRLELVAIDGSVHRTLADRPVGPFAWSSDSSGLTFLALPEVSATSGSLAWVEAASAKTRTLGIEGVSWFQERRLTPVDDSPDFPSAVLTTPWPTTTLASPPLAVERTAGPSAVATPVPARPPTSHRLAYTFAPLRLDSEGRPLVACGKRLEVLDLDSGHLSEPVKGCHLQTDIAADGRHVFVGHLTNVFDETGEPVTTGDPSKGTLLDLVDGSRSSVDVADGGYISFSPGGQWMSRRIRTDEPLAGYREIARVGSSHWIRLPELYCEIPVEPHCSGPYFAWSSDETRLIVRSAEHAPDDDRAGHPLYLIGNADGTDLMPIPATTGWPVFSADLRRVAYADAGGAVWTANIDGSDNRDIARFDFGGINGIAISPDGATTAIMQDRAVWLIDASGTRHRVDLPTVRGGNVPEIVWSPDSSRLAVSISAIDAPGPGRTVVLAADGSLIAKLDASRVAWSPDGEHVAVWVEPGDLHPVHTTAALPSKGDGTTYLVGRDGAVVKLSGAWGASWSPDSAHVALVARHGSRDGIDVVDADGTGRQTVTKRSVGNSGAPVWVPDPA